MDNLNPNQQSLLNFARRQIVLAAGLGAATAASAGLLTWLILKPATLLPLSVANQIDTFDPYFFTQPVPAGFSVNRKQVTFENGLLMVPLAKPDGTQVVLTEQHLSGQLSETQLLQGGDRLTGTLHPASINDVEDRRVGVMIDTGHQTLILINAPSAIAKDDLATLLRALKPVR